MPHAIYLGSRIATSRRTHDESAKKMEESSSGQADVAFVPSVHMPQPVRLPPMGNGDVSNLGGDQPPRSLLDIQRHVSHASWDVALSLVIFALVINSSILIVSCAAFYNTTNPVTDLFGAYALIQAQVGQVPALMFALGLLASGQCASITVTLAGQTISEGFLQWRTNPIVRRLVTRGIGIIPSVIIATSSGRQGLNTLLIASQSALSVVLPFVIFPYVQFLATCSLASSPSQSIADPTYLAFSCSLRIHLS
jgi:metal iron transporter